MTLVTARWLSLSSVGRARVESTQTRKKRESGAAVVFVVVIVGIGYVLLNSGASRVRVKSAMMMCRVGLARLLSWERRGLYLSEGLGVVCLACLVEERRT